MGGGWLLNYGARLNLKCLDSPGGCQLKLYNNQIIRFKDFDERVRAEKYKDILGVQIIYPT